MLSGCDSTIVTIVPAACFKKIAELLNDYESVKLVGMAFVY